MTLTFDPKYKFEGFTTWLCVQVLSFFFFWHSHTMFFTWVYHHVTMCRVHSCPLYDLDLWPKYHNYIFTMNLSRERSSLSFDIHIQNFGLRVIHHETTCRVHFWPLYDLNLWPLCGWQRVSLVIFTQSFILFIFLRCKHGKKSSQDNE